MCLADFYKVGETTYQTALHDVSANCRNLSAYRDNDDIATVHEATHAINSQLRNSFGGRKVNAFYLLNGHALVLNEPPTTLEYVATNIPAPMRGTIFNIYLVEQKIHWNDSPLYILDELDAYINGSIYAIQSNNYARFQDSFQFAEEMYGYSVCLLYAINNVPQYDNTELIKAIRFFGTRLTWTYHHGIKRGFISDRHDNFYIIIQKDRDLEYLRQYLFDVYEDEWCNNNLGLFR